MQVEPAGMLPLPTQGLLDYVLTISLTKGTIKRDFSYIYHPWLLWVIFTALLSSSNLDISMHLLRAVGCCC